MERKDKKRTQIFVDGFVNLNPSPGFNYATGLTECKYQSRLNVVETSVVVLATKKHVVNNFNH